MNGADLTEVLQHVCGPAAHDQTAGTSECRVLLVEDNPHVRVIVRAALATFALRSNLNLTMRIDTAGDGLAALGMLMLNRYDVVLTDIYMPSLDGLALLERVRQTQPNLPVIVLSAGAEEVRAKAYEAGAADFIPKPMLATDIRRALTHVMRQLPQFREALIAAAATAVTVPPEASAAAYATES